MPIEERRRLALHQHASATWGEEVADTLMELVTPAGHELATKQDLDRFEARVDRRFERLEERLGAFEVRVDDRLAAFEHRMDDRFEGFEHRFDGFEARIRGHLHELGERFERRIADAVTTQTRTLVLSQLGALVVIAALAFGLR